VGREGEVGEEEVGEGEVALELHGFLCLQYFSFLLLPYLPRSLRPGRRVLH